MTDVAQILGVGRPKNDAAKAPPPPPPATHQPSRAMKLQGMPREVIDLISGKQDAKSAELPPAVPAGISNEAVKANKEDAVKVGNKYISKSKPARKWVWAPFSSSSRTDGALFHHWVRSNVEYPDYPYARFDIHLDAVMYNEEEYRRYLTSDKWSKSETDQLMELSRRFELRWPVIYDRWQEMFDISSEDEKGHRKIEDLQHRYYQVAAIMTQSRISQEAAAEAQALAASAPDPSEDIKTATDNLLMETAAARALASTDPAHQPLIHNIGSGTSNKVFDLNYERGRRAQMEALWQRTKEEEAEEAELRKELKQVEAQLRKIKKAGGHIVAAAAGGTGASSLLSSAASSRNPSRSVSPVPSSESNPALMDHAFASTAPTPMPQNPYLQSGRLQPPATGGAVGLNKTLLTRMDQVLEDMKIPERPLPTKRVCDLYDSVRKDILTLLILQKNALQKEGLVQSKRLKLAKMGGNVRVVQEEALMGITPTPAPSPAPAAAAARGGGAKGAARTGKSKATSGGGKGKPKAKTTDDSGKTDTTKDAPAGSKQAPSGKGARKTATKRKRKSDQGKNAPSASTAAAGDAGAASKPAETGESSSKPPGKKRAKKSS